MESAYVVTVTASWYVDKVVDADHAKLYVHDQVAAAAIAQGVRYTVTATEVENGEIK